MITACQEIDAAIGSMRQEVKKCRHSSWSLVISHPADAHCRCSLCRSATSAHRSDTARTKWRRHRSKAARSRASARSPARTRPHTRPATRRGWSVQRRPCDRWHGSLGLLQSQPDRAGSTCQFRHQTNRSEEWPVKPARSGSATSMRQIRRASIVTCVLLLGDDQDWSRGGPGAASGVWVACDERWRNVVIPRGLL